MTAAAPLTAMRPDASRVLVSMDAAAYYADLTSQYRRYGGRACG